MKYKNVYTFTDEETNEFRVRNRFFDQEFDQGFVTTTCISEKNNRYCGDVTVYFNGSELPQVTRAIPEIQKGWPEGASQEEIDEYLLKEVLKEATRIAKTEYKNLITSLNKDPKPTPKQKCVTTGVDIINRVKLWLDCNVSNRKHVNEFKSDFLRKIENYEPISNGHWSVSDQQKDE